MKALSNFIHKTKNLGLSGVVLRLVWILCTICCLCYAFLEMKTASTKICFPEDKAPEWINDDDIVYSADRVTGENRESAAGNKNLPRKNITILLYTKYYEGEWSDTPEETLTAQQCKHLKTPFFTSNESSMESIFSLPCRITSDRKHFNDSDAIIFHSRDLLKTELPKGYRNENQLWVYMQQESQIYTKPNLKRYSNVFNWTMTHRHDSDVYHPYGYLVPRSSNGNSTKFDFLPSINKTGLVAWIVSHCHPKSKRDVFVQELKKYIQVDIFGGCGQRCPSSANVDCYTYVASNYKMYLSFENSLCTDYITEKFFKALNYNMLPIVYGGGRGGAGEDYSAIAPNGSYIDTRSFESTEQLAKYILYLSKNDSEFLKFFEWKKKYQVILVNNHNRWCNLCQKLYEHVNKVPSPVKWYKDLWRWWKYVEVINGSNRISTPLLGGNLKNKMQSCSSPPSKLTRMCGK